MVYTQIVSKSHNAFGNYETVLQMLLLIKFSNFVVTKVFFLAYETCVCNGIVSLKQH